MGAVGATPWSLRGPLVFTAAGGEGCWIILQAHVLRAHGDAGYTFGEWDFLLVGSLSQVCRLHGVATGMRRHDIALGLAE